MTAPPATEAKARPPGRRAAPGPATGLAAWLARFALPALASTLLALAAGTGQAFEQAQAAGAASTAIPAASAPSTAPAAPAATAAALRTPVVTPGLASPLGVFYYPGWKRGALGLPAGPADPWERIRAFPEREPLLGWYDEGNDDVMAQQLRWMQQHGVGFVVFDWYWGAEQEYLGHALRAYHRVPERRGTPYALMWANHGRAPLSRRDFSAMVEELLDRHLKRPEYLRVDGRPLVFIQLPEQLDRNARLLGSDGGQLLQEAQAMARRAGLAEGILFVAGANAGPGGVADGMARAQGYGAYFNYNYHAGPGARTRGQLRFSHSFAELDEGYRAHWDWFLRQGDLPYIVPLTAGWDKRPWGGSSDPRHDDSIPSDAEFLAHLRAGAARLAAEPVRTLGLAVLCCWNEFGEGSIVEPTKARGLRTLEAVRSVFAR